MEPSEYQSLNNDSKASAWGELNHHHHQEDDAWGTQQTNDIFGSNPYGNSGYSETTDSGTANTALGAGNTAFSTVGQRNPYESGGNLFEVDIHDNPYSESPADPNSQQSRRSGYRSSRYRPSAQDYGDDDQLILGG
ncbi:MAG: hypothetical protein F6K32_16500 [Desertifilum sp. SIO1I2]|nr:hypothetical protein [Desertifilum sp. SIO1I2]